MIAAYEAMLQAHLDSVGYPRPFQPFEPVSIDTSPERLRMMDVEELSEVALELANAAYAVGDEYNRQKAKAERCQTKIAQLVGKRIDHSIYGSADKWMKAAFSDPVAKRYWQHRQNALATAARLEGQSLRLSELTKVINNMIYLRK